MSDPIKPFPEAPEFPTPAIAARAEAALEEYRRIRNAGQLKQDEEIVPPQEEDFFASLCESGDVEGVRDYIQKTNGQYLNWVCAAAIRCDQFEVAKMLIESMRHNLDIEKWLSCAATYGRKNMVEFLIERRTNGRVLAFALESAIEYGHHDIANLLIDSGADIKSTNGPIQLAIRMRQAETVRWLMEKGASINGVFRKTYGYDYKNAMTIAAVDGATDILRLLIEKDADVEVGDNEPIIMAAAKGQTECIRILVENGANIAARDYQAISNAVQNGHHETLRFLLENMLSPLTKGRLAKELFQAVRLGQAKVAEALMDHGADIKSVVVEDETILNFMRWSRRFPQQTSPEDMFRILLESNALDGARALRLAITLMNTKFAKIILKHGVDVTVNDNEFMKSAGFMLGIERGPGYKHDILEMSFLLSEYGGDESVLEDEAREKMIEFRDQVYHWRRVVRRDPLHHLHNENPAYFKGACYEAVRRMLDEEEYSGIPAVEMAFYTAALFQSEARVLQYLRQWKGDGKQPLHDLVYMIKFPPARIPYDLPNLKDWGDAILRCGPSMARLFKFSDRIPSPFKTDDGRTWSMVKTRAECAKYGYKNASANFALAALCMEHEVGEASFDKAIDIIQRKTSVVKNIPEIEIKGEAFGMPGGRFIRLPDNDVRGLFLGEMTNCCQSVGGNGHDCAVHGFESPHGGFYVVENSKGKIVGQSWAWRGKKGELCLDSLETLGQNVVGSQWRAIIHGLRDALVSHNDMNVTALTIGKGGQTERSYPQVTEEFSQRAKAKPKSYHGYRDSDKQILVWSAPGL